MSRSSRHRPRRGIRGSARVLVPLILGVAVLGGGTAFAGYRYDAATNGRILPGAEIHGVDVGDMTRAQAVAAVSEVADEILQDDIRVTVDGATWRPTRAELGTTADVEAMVDRALGSNASYGWPTRVFYRLTDRPVDQRLDLTFTADEDGVARFVDEVAGELRVEPRDAAIAMGPSEPKLTKAKGGQRLIKKRAREALIEAASDPDDDAVRFRLKRLRPEVRQRDLGHTIVVRISEKKLYLYDGFDVVKTYSVATGTAQYPTPTGEFEIINKAVNPSWTNPAPNGWGAGMPRFIPGGPNGPLGTRALYLNSPGIRIHGTSADSSIGTAASHGCIRMHRWDVEELYDIVEIDTPVYIYS
ncbi:MAG: L,D-transpeptidase/peptidoglycan binding protein, partial [Actinomycetota bacterium]|nr:L,D-transpeptidase/peptidoglycan binding protein [Actinomycetota bacterium]